MELTLVGRAQSPRRRALNPAHSEIKRAHAGSRAHAKLRRAAGCGGSHWLMTPNLVMQLDRRQIRFDT
jgi:hypothetical protein